MTATRERFDVEAERRKLECITAGERRRAALVGLCARNTQHLHRYRGAYDLRPFAPVRT